MGVDVVRGLLDELGVGSVGKGRVNDDVKLRLALGKGEGGVCFGELGEDVLEIDSTEEKIKSATDQDE